MVGAVRALDGSAASLRTVLRVRAPLGAFDSGKDCGQPERRHNLTQKNTMDNTDNKKMASACSAPVKKYKLSELIAAFKAGDVELDCKAGLAWYTEGESGGAMDFELLKLNNRDDFAMLCLHNGLAAIMALALALDSEALATLIKMEYRYLRMKAEDKCKIDLFSKLFAAEDGDAEQAVTGEKEGGDE